MREKIIFQGNIHPSESLASIVSIIQMHFIDMYHAVQTLQISKLLCHHCGKTFLRDGTFKLYIRMHNFTEGKLVSGKIF